MTPPRFLDKAALAQTSFAQTSAARVIGHPALGLAPGFGGGLDGMVDSANLQTLPGIAAVVFWGDEDEARGLRLALSVRSAPIIPLIAAADVIVFCQAERHLCIDANAAGGNASLLSNALRLNAHDLFAA